MDKQMLWNLFRNTGKIEYYIKYKNWNGSSERSNSREKI